MRAIFLLALAVVLAVPAVAVADRGSSDPSRATRESSKSAAQKRAKAKLRTIKRPPRLVRSTDDEREVRGRIASLAPLRVGSLTCVAPSSVSVAAFRVGDFVEVTCDLVRGQWVLRKLKLEDDDEFGDDERELTGWIASLSPLTVGSVTCVVPAGISLAGFRVGDLVEITCDRIRGQWVLRRVKHEDRADDEDRIGRDDNSGPGSGRDDDDNSGHGSGDDDDDDDNSGPGAGDDDDHSGSGGSGPG